MNSIELLAAYWRAGRSILNLGDYVTEVLLNLFGYECISYDRAIRCNRLGDFETCLFATGTILDFDWFNRISMKKSVWGSGDWGDARLTRLQLDQCRFYSVRGPLTIRRLSLPDATPTGDPALVLPLLAPMRKQNESGVIYIPHFNARMQHSRAALIAVGASRFVTPAVTQEEFFPRLQTIVDADFVLTGSLHGAIIAQAYNRPWALCLPPAQSLNKQGKWDDWFAYLGLDLSICRDYQQGLRWWQTKGRFGAIRDLRPMMRSLPFAIRASTTKIVWENALTETAF